MKYIILIFLIFIQNTFADCRESYEDCDFRCTDELKMLNICYLPHNYSTLTMGVTKETEFTDYTLQQQCETSRTVTSGTLIGTMLAAKDFTNDNQDLIVVVDGSTQTVSITANCNTPTNCAIELNSKITGASVSAFQLQLNITSDTTGYASSVTIVESGSGVDALDLFGHSTVIDGTGNYAEPEKCCRCIIIENVQYNTNHRKRFIRDECEMMSRSDPLRWSTPDGFMADPIWEWSNQLYKCELDKMQNIHDYDKLVFENSDKTYNLDGSVEVWEYDGDPAQKSWTEPVMEYVTPKEYQTLSYNWFIENKKVGTGLAAIFHASTRNLFLPLFMFLNIFINKECPAGKYAVGYNCGCNGFPTECKNLKFCPGLRTSAATCEFCPLGTWSLSNLDSACQACVAGMYGDEPYGDSIRFDPACTDCDGLDRFNKSTLVPFTSRITGNRLFPCKVCPAGKYSPPSSTKEKDCTPVPVGMYRRLGDAAPKPPTYPYIFDDEEPGHTMHPTHTCHAGKFLEPYNRPDLPPTRAACLDCPTGFAPKMDVKLPHVNIGSSGCDKCSYGKYWSPLLIKDDIFEGVGCEKGSFSAGTATSGTLTGVSFNIKDFTSDYQDLIVVVDGTTQTVSITANCDTLTNCATELNSKITGASVSVDYPNLKITSLTIGSTSSVVIMESGSGVDALDLFGHSTVIDTGTAGTLTTGCQPCDIGTYSSQKGAEVCTPCESGRFAAIKHKTDCDLCPVGKYQDSEGATRCLNCPVGWFNTNLRFVEQSPLADCLMCEKGKYQNKEGQSDLCKICPVGYYNDQLETDIVTDGGTTTIPYVLDTCKKCGKGKFMNQGTTGSISETNCENCPAGKYGDQEAVTYVGCKACPSGTSSSLVAATMISECVGCSAGSWQGSGQTKCTLCVSGKYYGFGGGDHESVCIICPAGKISGEGAEACSECPAGTYLLDTPEWTLLLTSDVTAAAGVTVTQGTNIGILKTWYKLTNPDRTYLIVTASSDDATFVSTVDVIVDSTTVSASTFTSATSNSDTTRGSDAALHSAITSLGSDIYDSCISCGVGKWSDTTGASYESFCKDCVAGKYDSMIGYDGENPGLSRGELTGTSFNTIDFNQRHRCSLGIKFNGNNLINILLTPLCDDLESCAQEISLQIQSYALLKIEDGNLKIATYMKGSTSSVSISTPVGLNGMLIGTGFTSKDFTNDNQDLFVSVDGGSTQNIRLTANCETPANCAEHINTQITGATVSVDNGQLKITSGTTGPSSSINIVFGGISSYRAIKVLFGSWHRFRGENPCPDAMNLFGNPIMTDGSMPCKFCPKGKWDDQLKSTLCTKCAAGKYINQIGQTTESISVNCPAGKYGTQSGQPTEISACVNCPKGKWSNDVGRTSCTNCVKGKYGTQLGFTSETSCNICQVGRISISEGQVECDICPTGKYLTDTATDAALHDQEADCQGCPAGKHGPSGTILTSEQDCIVCSEGKYNEQIGQQSCKDCSIGKYNDAAGQNTDCKVCLIGKYNEEKGQKICKICKYGQYQDDTNRTRCKDCPRGKYITVDMSSEEDHDALSDCVGCEIGTYHDYEGCTDEHDTSTYCRSFNTPQNGFTAAQYCVKKRRMYEGEMCILTLPVRYRSDIKCHDPNGDFPDYKCPKGDCTTGTDRYCEWSSTGTAGTLTGNAFYTKDFTNDNQDLIVVLDGNPQTVNITANCDTLDNCATGLNNLITGATVSREWGNLKIMSDTTGTSSSISITDNGSGVNALLLFGTYIQNDGSKCFGHSNCLQHTTEDTCKYEDRQDPTSGQTCRYRTNMRECSICKAGKYQDQTTQFKCKDCPKGKHLLHYTQILLVTVDDIESVVKITSDCDTLTNCATELNSKITGATVSVDGSNLKITSDTIGSTSSVEITDNGSGTNALALFGTPTMVNGTASTAGTLSGSSFTAATFNPYGVHHDSPVDCESCNAGKYGDEIGQTLCKNCISGKYADSLGAQSDNVCTNCPPGKDAPILGSISCKTCSEGFWGNGYPVYRQKIKKDIWENTGKCWGNIGSFYTNNEVQCDSYYNNYFSCTASQIGTFRGTDTVYDYGYGVSLAECRWRGERNMIGNPLWGEFVDVSTYSLTADEIWLDSWDTDYNKWYPNHMMTTTPSVPTCDSPDGGDQCESTPQRNLGKTGFILNLQNDDSRSDTWNKEEKSCEYTRRYHADPTLMATLCKFDNNRNGVNICDDDDRDDTWSECNGFNENTCEYIRRTDNSGNNCIYNSQEPEYTGMKTCNKCPMGKWHSLTGETTMVGCVNCDAGKYSGPDDVGCKLCPDGKSSTVTGLPFADNWCSNGNNKLTNWCPLYFNKQRCNQRHQISDVALQVQFYKSNPSSCKFHEAGCVNCAAGKTGFEGSCEDCGAGFYQEGNECKTCPSGYGTDQVASTSCKECPRGRWSYIGNVNEDNLPSNQVSGRMESLSTSKGGTMCMECPLGTRNYEPGATGEWKVIVNPIDFNNNSIPSGDGISATTGCNQETDCKTANDKTCVQSLPRYNEFDVDNLLICKWDSYTKKCTSDDDTNDFTNGIHDLIVVVDGGTIQTVTIPQACKDQSSCATGLNNLINGATVSVVDGSNLKITSDTTGMSSSVTIESGSSSKALLLFGTRTDTSTPTHGSLTGTTFFINGCTMWGDTGGNIDSENKFRCERICQNCCFMRAAYRGMDSNFISSFSTAATLKGSSFTPYDFTTNTQDLVVALDETAGTLTGRRNLDFNRPRPYWAPKDFTSGAEDLVVVVDGNTQTVTITANCVTLDNCATELNSKITGATVMVDGNNLKITSETIGSTSSVTIVESGSGADALALFKGGSYSTPTQVDGTSNVQTVNINVNCDTRDNCAKALTFRINGATVTVDGGNLKITSDTTGTSSTVSITETGSGSDALALFGTPTMIQGVTNYNTIENAKTGQRMWVESIEGTTSYFTPGCYETCHSGTADIVRLPTNNYIRQQIFDRKTIEIRRNDEMGSPCWWRDETYFTNRRNTCESGLWITNYDDKTFVDLGVVGCNGKFTEDSCEWMADRGDVFPYCTQCEKGRYAAEFGLGDCIECPTGKYNTEFGQDKCINKSTTCTNAQQKIVTNTDTWRDNTCEDKICGCKNGQGKTRSDGDVEHCVSEDVQDCVTCASIPTGTFTKTISDDGVSQSNLYNEPIHCGTDTTKGLSLYELQGNSEKDGYTAPEMPSTCTNIDGTSLNLRYSTGILTGNTFNNYAFEEIWSTFNTQCKCGSSSICTNPTWTVELSSSMQIIEKAGKPVYQDNVLVGVLLQQLTGDVDSFKVRTITYKKASWCSGGGNCAAENMAYTCPRYGVDANGNTGNCVWMQGDDQLPITLVTNKNITINTVSISAININSITAELGSGMFCHTDTCSWNAACNADQSVVNTNPCKCGTNVCTANQWCHADSGTIACSDSAPTTPQCEFGSTGNTNECTCGDNVCTATTGLICTPPTCANTDSTTENTVPCKCGTNTCTGSSTKCSSSSNTCSEPSSGGDYGESDYGEDGYGRRLRSSPTRRKLWIGTCTAQTCANTDSTTANTVPCQCGTNTCTGSSTMCSSSSNTCTTPCEFGSTGNYNTNECTCGDNVCTATTGLICTPPTCTGTDGYTANTVPCQCGTNTCTGSSTMCYISSDGGDGGRRLLTIDGDHRRRLQGECTSPSSEGDYGESDYGRRLRSSPTRRKLWTGTCTEPPTCANTDGYTANTVPCKCGTNTCTGSSTKCSSSSNTCSEPSSGGDYGEGDYGDGDYGRRLRTIDGDSRRRLQTTSTLTGRGSCRCTELCAVNQHVKDGVCVDCTTGVRAVGDNPDGANTYCWESNELCSVGKYSENPGDACQDCPVGKYQDQNVQPSVTCKFCTIGKQFVDKQTACQDCPTGKFQPEFESIVVGSCAFCAAGKQFVDSSTECEECTYGKYQPQSTVSSANCEFCTAGKIFTAKETACDDCTNGKYQSENVNHVSNTCKECSIGRYTPAKDQECQDCETGKFQELWAATDYTCKFCAAGKEFNNQQYEVTAATSGTLKGSSFTAYDFTSSAQNLVVVVDGTVQTVSITANCDTLANCVTHLNTLITGAIVVVDYEDTCMKITSDTTGTSSSVDIATTGSGTNALALFVGRTLIGSRFTVHDFSSVNENLIVTVDGTVQTVSITVNCDTLSNCATELNSKITGATVSVDSDNLKITSDTTGTSSSVYITISGSSTYALALFGLSGNTRVLGSGAGYCLDCGNGQYQDNNDQPSVTCKICTDGTQFVAVDSICANCPSGKYSTISTNIPHEFNNYNEDLVLIVDGGSAQTATIAANCKLHQLLSATLASCATELNSKITGATVSVDGSNLKITSDTTGSTSSVEITSSGTGANALALFGTSTMVSGTATAGTLTGTGFNTKDFTSDYQDLIVFVDGGSTQTVSITANCDTLTNCATELNSKITGASVSVDNGQLKITSDTTGYTSSVTIVESGSGVDALDLFGHSTVIDGTGTAGTLTGTTVTYDFSNYNQYILVTVDKGTVQTVSITANCDTLANCATDLNSKITGGTVSVDGGNLKITSDTKIITSQGTTIGTVSITSEYTEALSLFQVQPPATCVNCEVGKYQEQNGQSQCKFCGIGKQFDASNLKITSYTTGTSSSVAITTTGSGTNALALFGTSTQVYGTTSTVGTLTGTSFTGYDFYLAGRYENLVVTVDGGIPQTVSITANCNTLSNCAAELNSKITGAFVAVDGTCSTCEAGKYQDQTTAESVTCEYCPTGYEILTSSVCQICPTGKNQESYGAYTCKTSQNCGDMEENFESKNSQHEVTLVSDDSITTNVAYSITPPLTTFTKGWTYILNVQTEGYPFCLVTDITNVSTLIQPCKSIGKIKITVPSDESVSNIQYRSQNHAVMNDSIPIDSIDNIRKTYYNDCLFLNESSAAPYNRIYDETKQSCSSSAQIQNACRCFNSKSIQTSMAVSGEYCTDGKFTVGNIAIDDYSISKTCIMECQPTTTTDHLTVANLTNACGRKGKCRGCKKCKDLQDNNGKFKEKLSRFLFMKAGGLIRDIGGCDEEVCTDNLKCSGTTADVCEGCKICHDAAEVVPQNRGITYDFSSVNQVLVVVVDGTAQTVSITANCDTLANCRNELSSKITGATVSVYGNDLKITSDTTGTSSSISITDNGSGANALALFPEPLSIGGMGYSSGTLTGTSFIVTLQGNIFVQVDNGAVQTISYTSANCDTLANCATDLSSKITGATVSVDGGNLKITSNTVGVNSKIYIKPYHLCSVHGCLYGDEDTLFGYEKSYINGKGPTSGYLMGTTTLNGVFKRRGPQERTSGDGSCMSACIDEFPTRGTNICKWKKCKGCLACTLYRKNTAGTSYPTDATTNADTAFFRPRPRTIDSDDTRNANVPSKFYGGCHLWCRNAFNYADGTQLKTNNAGITVAAARAKVCEWRSCSGCKACEEEAKRLDNNTPTKEFKSHDGSGACLGTFLCRNGGVFHGTAKCSNC